MAVAERSTKITVDLKDPQLYRGLRMAAIEQDRTVRDIITEAAHFWLKHQDLVEDVLSEEKIKRVQAGSSGELVAHAEVKRSLT
jgi:hypothetical protein